MPSRKDTMKFIVDNDLKSQLKGFSKNSINELNERVDNLLKDAGVVENKWKRLKLKTDASPEQAESTKKLVRRETLKAGTPKKIVAKKPQAKTIEGEISNLMRVSDRQDRRKKPQAKTIEGEISNLMRVSDRQDRRKKK